MADNQKEATLLLKIKTAGEEAFDTVKDKMAMVATAAAAVAAAVVAFVAKGVQAFREQEEATNKLNQAMANAGVYSEELSKNYQDQASALQKVTLFGDEAILAAQATIQAQIGQTKITSELTRSTLDFAQAMGMDASSAANAIGKTIGTSTNALARYGIELKEGMTSQQKMTAVMTQLNQKFGGQAEAAGRGLGIPSPALAAGSGAQGPDEGRVRVHSSGDGPGRGRFPLSAVQPCLGASGR
jgi:hypothetical protein